MTNQSLVSANFSAWLRNYLLNRRLQETVAILEASMTEEGAVVRSDLYEATEANSTEPCLIDTLTHMLSPADESVAHYLGFINDDEEYGDAALYLGAVGMPGQHWTFWLTLITEDESKHEIRLFQSRAAAEAHLAAFMMLQTGIEPIVTWESKSRTYNKPQ